MKAASEQSEGHTQRTAPLLSVKEAAAYLHMSVSWVNQTLRKLCPARKIGRSVKYMKDDLDRFIERSATFHLETHMSKSLVAIEGRHGKTIPHKK
jgi:predicted DNA-binding transcriptional regulator AlpA